MLSTKQVAFGVSDRPILRGIDFQAGPGEFVGIIGPNGSGKSTFLKQVYKVLRPQGGEIRLLGADLLSMSNCTGARVRL